MPRIARVVVGGLPYHITQRGNYGQVVFDEDDDRRTYLKWLRTYSRSSGLRLWAYCLMPNHVHFVAVPDVGKEDALARTFNQLHMRYAQYLNGKRKQRGHLWQGRFYSCPLDERHLYEAVKYVERNPVRVRLVSKPGDYPWSSAHSHIAREANPILSSGCPLVEAVADWAEYLAVPEDEQVLRELRVATRTGRPAGDESFVQRLAGILGRNLLSLPCGRPRKRESNTEESDTGK